MRLKRGISPVIATVIIVAVAIAISIAVAGWLFGLWGGLAGGTPQVMVSSVTVYSNGTIKLYIVNDGSGADTLLRVEVSNATGTYATDIAETSIPANYRGWITGTVQGTGINFPVGSSVTVKAYFEKSGSVTIPVTVVKGS